MTPGGDVIVTGSRTTEGKGAVAWGPIIAGAVAAAGLSLILVTLGSGLGFASISPWSSNGASVTTFSIMTAIWFVLIQWLSAGLGGYLTGRLRTRWTNVHDDEVYFRDTAHGFLAWALATLLVAGVLAGATSAVVSAGSRAVATVAGGAAQGAATEAVRNVGLGPYFVDSLYRTDQPTIGDNDQALRGETSRILATGLGGVEISAEDRTYLAKVVAAKTGLSQADAEKRVDDVIAKVKVAEVKAREPADKARKAAATTALLTALALMVGALIGAAAAALGGVHRDEWTERLARLR